MKEKSSTQAQDPSDSPLTAALSALQSYEALKIGLTSAAFSLIVFSHSMIKAVKDSVFLSMVGASYQPWAKLVVILSSIVIFMPIYSMAMGRLSRKTVSIIFPCIYAAFALAFGLFLMHPTIGLENTITAPNRLTGWVSYVFLEFYSVAVLATFWSLINSISTPKSSKRQYGIMTIASRIAGISASLLGLYVARYSNISQTFAFPIILGLCAASLVLVAILIRTMFRVLPEKYLTGYTDIHEKPKVSEKKKAKKQRFLEGLYCVLTEPYAIGIFGIIASLEVISTIMDYRMQCLIAAGAGNCAMKMLHQFFVYTLSFQIAGLFLATFATTTLPQKIGVRRCLLVTPLAIMAMVALSFGFDTLYMAMAVQIAVRAFNYGFNEPVREMLYVPASHKIQFRAKGWVDTFGKTLSKGSGAGLNILVSKLSPMFASLVSLSSAMLMGVSWLFIVIFVGNKYHKAVKNQQVIGNN